ncbi:MAG TPA: Ig-like domain repeat protein [Conexibacter sp.]|nr:Ig-like domain repeat protein [Conexibacter sp.]
MSLRTRLSAVLASAGAAGAALLLLLLGAAGGAPAVAVAADCPQPPPSSQTSQSFDYAGYVEQFAVPAWVNQLTVTVRGGHGGSRAGTTGAGGRPGVVTGVVPVTPGSCLDVTVGAYGGGFGLGSGGSGGGMSGGGLGPFGGGGGGGSAIAPQGGAALVVAGGGGGGGGNGVGSGNPDQGTPGAGGGDGAGGRGPGTPQGGNGGQPPHGHPQLDLGEGVYGIAEQGRGTAGEDAVHWQFAEVLCGNLTGGGGGGGGGIKGGGAGTQVIPNYSNPDNQMECYPDFGFGGGGGAGGDSYADATVQDPAFTVDPGSCPPDGQLVAACWGEVVLDWSIDVGKVAAAGGSAQATTIGTRYPGLLQARVTAKDGAPIPGLAVTFTLPASGPSGTFDTGADDPRTVTLTTDDSGVATAPPLLANAQVGNFTATATVAGFGQSAGFALANDPAATATSLWTVPADPSVTLEPVRFVAQVRQAPSTAPQPVGVVAFRVDGRQVATVPVDGDGTAISDPLPLATGDHPVEAIYYPDNQFRGSRATLTQRVVRASTAVEVASSANPSEDDDAVVFSATVAPVAPGAGTPTGAVSFLVDGRALGAPVALSSGGVAQSAPIRLPSGTHGVTASYDGDDGYEPSDGAFVQEVGATATATVLSASPRNPVVGQATEITATVLPPSANASAVPTGGVDVLVDGIVVCDAVTLVAGRATCAVEAPSLPGPHQITAVYDPGSPDFDASSGALSQLVAKARAQVSLEASPDPSVFGEAVRLHAQVAAAGPASGVPSGTVTFTVDGAPVGAPVLLRDGRADSVAIPRLEAGPHVLRASYSGDASFVANAVGATQAVDRGQTLGTLVSSAPQAQAGAALVYTFNAAVAPPSSGVPGGSVRFSVDGRPWGPPVALRDGTAVSAPVGGLRGGAHLVRAAYLGAAGYQRVDAQLTQWIGGPLTPLGPPVTPHDPALRPVAPPLVPASQRSPLLCTRELALTAVGVRGQRVQVRGVADGDLVGQRVAIVSGGKVLARPRVQAGGGFSARVPRPRGVREADAVYIATAGSARSQPVALAQPLRIVSVRAVTKRRVRIEAVLAGGGARPLRARVERRVGCGRTITVARPAVQAPRRGSGAHRIVVTVARPATGQGTAAVTLFAGRLAALPLLVKP